MGIPKERINLPVCLLGALTLARHFQPFGGVYKPAIDKVAVGVGSNLTGLEEVNQT